MSAADDARGALDDARDLLERVFAPDAVKVFAMFAGIWLLFYWFGDQLGYADPFILALVRRVTETYAAVDRLVVGAADWSTRALFTPGEAVTPLTDRLAGPEWGQDAGWVSSGSRMPDVTVRLSVGFVTAGLTVVLLVLLW